MCTPVVSPVTPSNSSSSSAYSAKPTSWISSDELDSAENASRYTHQAQVSGFNAIGMLFGFNAFIMLQ